MIQVNEVIAKLLSCHSRESAKPVNTEIYGSPLSRRRYDRSNLAIGFNVSIYGEIAKTFSGTDFTDHTVCIYI